MHSYDNVPLISYLVLGGRCRAYGRRKSPRYFVVELLTALLAAALYYQFGLGVAFLVAFVYVAALIVISFIDLDVRIVPDIISLSGIVVGLLYSVVGRYLISDPLDLVPTPVSALTGAVAGREFLLAVAWLYERVRGGLIAWAGLRDYIHRYAKVTRTLRITPYPFAVKITVNILCANKIWSVLCSP